MSSITAINGNTDTLYVCRYGYFRPHVRLFDPGWHGLQVKGEEDENTGDNGNDPLGVLAR